MTTVYFLQNINSASGLGLSLSYLLDDIFLKNSKEFIY